MRVSELEVDRCWFTGDGLEKALTAFKACLEKLTIKTEVDKVEKDLQIGGDTDEESSNQEDSGYIEWLVVSAFKGLLHLRTACGKLRSCGTG